MNKEELNKKLSELEKTFGLTRSKDKEIKTIRTNLYALDYVIDGIKLIILWERKFW